MYEAVHSGKPGRERRCEPLIRKLKRPGSESTGVDAIEKSWKNLETVTSKLANAFVGVIDQSTYSPMGPRRARLVTALDAMDAAHAKLRQDSGMKPLTARSTMAPPSTLPEGIRPPGVDFPVDTIELSNSTLVLEGDSGDQWARVVVRGPADGLRYAYRPNHNLQVAADDAHWVIWSSVGDQGRQRLYAAELDDTGAPTGTETTAYIAPDANYIVTPRFALGQGTSRAVFFVLEHYTDALEPDRALHSVRSTDSGATWSAPVRVAESDHVTRADFGNRQFDIITRDPDGNVRWLPIQANTLLSPIKPRRIYKDEALTEAPIPAIDPLVGCTRGDSGWWLRDMSMLYHVAGESDARPVELSSDGVSLVGCTEKYAILSSFADTGVLLHRCDTRSCTEVRTLPQASQSSYVAGISQESGFVGVTQTNRLILMWRGDEPVRAYLGQPEDQIRELVEWNGIIHLLMTTEGGDLRLVPLT
jgi:hypothetical protein